MQLANQAFMQSLEEFSENRKKQIRESILKDENSKVYAVEYNNEK